MATENKSDSAIKEESLDIPSNTANDLSLNLEQSSSSDLIIEEGQAVASSQDFEVDPAQNKISEPTDPIQEPFELPYNRQVTFSVINLALSALVGFYMFVSVYILIVLISIVLSILAIKFSKPKWAKTIEEANKSIRKARILNIIALILIIIIWLPAIRILFAVLWETLRNLLWMSDWVGT